MILNRQKKVRLATRPLREFLRKTQRELRIEDSEITIAFVSDAEIARWNEAYRKKPGPTDVLSFPATAGAIYSNGSSRPRAERNSAKPPHPLTVPDRGQASPSAGSRSPLATRHSPLFLGDIAIAPETAKRYARKNGRTLGNELRVLMLHGVLHLMGYDHESDNGRMNRIEQRLRRRLGIA